MSKYKVRNQVVTWSKHVRVHSSEKLLELANPTAIHENEVDENAFACLNHVGT